MTILPILLKDGYKVGHKFQYPDGTTLVYSNLTPRKSRQPDVQEIVFFGLQYFLKEYLIRQFNEQFFPAAQNKTCSRGIADGLTTTLAPTVFRMTTSLSCMILAIYH